MARDPRLDPRNILTTKLQSDEKVLALEDGWRLCPEFRMTGVVPAHVLAGHALSRKIIGGTWVRGVWAVTTANLRYVSSRRGPFTGSQTFDVSIPLKSLVAIERRRSTIRSIYEILYRGGSVRCSLSHPEKLLTQITGSTQIVPM
jgi:hypothetical protein